MWMSQGSQNGREAGILSFQGYRLTFLELKEALRGLLPTPEEMGKGQTLPHWALVHGTRGLTTHLSPFLPLQPQGASSHPSCQPQGLCTHCFSLHLPPSPQQLLPPLRPRAFAHTVPPFHLPSSPQQLLSALTSTPGPLHTLFFLHTTLQPFFTTISPTLLAPQNGIHPWGSQLTLHHIALSSASDSGSLFSVCLGICFILLGPELQGNGPLYPISP